MCLLSDIVLCFKIEHYFDRIVKHWNSLPDSPDLLVNNFNNGCDSINLSNNINRSFYINLFYYCIYL